MCTLLGAIGSRHCIFFVPNNSSALLHLVNDHILGSIALSQYVECYRKLWRVARVIRVIIKTSLKCSFTTTWYVLWWLYTIFK